MKIDMLKVEGINLTLSLTCQFKVQCHFKWICHSQMTLTSKRREKVMTFLKCFSLTWKLDKDNQSAFKLE